VHAITGCFSGAGKRISGGGQAAAARVDIAPQARRSIETAENKKVGCGTIIVAGGWIIGLVLLFRLIALHIPGAGSSKMEGQCPERADEQTTDTIGVYNQPWNHPQEKPYSRNFGRDNRIELVKISEAMEPSLFAAIMLP
jgi:hypothetical protein